MPRKPLIESRTLPYHINARANNRELFPGELEYVWRALTNELYLQQTVHGLVVHAFVLMPNHFHLIATCPTRGINEAMRDFLSASTRIINTRNRRWGRVFGGRYHWSLIRNPTYFAHAVKYVYRNPVKAGLCAEVSEYEFSTWPGLLGLKKLPLVVLKPFQELDVRLPESLAEMDAWLNEPHREEVNRAIQVGLKKPEFEPGKDRKTRSSVKLPDFD